MADCTYPPYTYDDDLIEAARRDGQTGVRVYRLADTVAVLGSGSRPEVELHLDTCQRDNMPILRRRGGGCAVVLDPGNVIVSVAATGVPFGHHRQHFDTLTHWLIGGLGHIGMPRISQAGICDLVLGDKKVGGACLRRSHDLLYYTASLLIDPDVEKVTRYLKHPPREPEYRRGRSHRDFMGSLATLVAVDTLCGDSVDDIHCEGFMGKTSGANVELVAKRLRHAMQPPDLQDPPATATGCYTGSPSRGSPPETPRLPASRSASWIPSPTSPLLWYGHEVVRRTGLGGSRMGISTPNGVGNMTKRRNEP